MDQPQKSRLTFLKRATDRQRPQRRHGVSLLPSLFTMGNLFCGYASLVHSLRGDFASAAVFIGVSFAFDMCDGFIARLTGTASDFGVEFDSLADVVSFGVAPAILSYSWGLSSLGRAGWVCCFIFVAAAALRLARFNIQSGSTDKRFFVGMPSPSAAAIPAATVFAFPHGLGPDDIQWAIPALAMVVGPALLMVSTIRFRSFKTIDLQARRPYTVLLLVAIGIIVVNVHLPYSLLTLAYGYLTWTFIEFGVTRLRHRRGDERDASGELIASGEAVDAPPARSVSRPKRR
jgi:CDP-diacylglycerol--serine O-phosphatidyltransferase